MWGAVFRIVLTWLVCSGWEVNGIVQRWISSSVLGRGTCCLCRLGLGSRHSIQTSRISRWPGTNHWSGESENRPTLSQAVELNPNTAVPQGSFGGWVWHLHRTFPLMKPQQRMAYCQLDWEENPAMNASLVWGLKGFQGWYPYPAGWELTELQREGAFFASRSSLLCVSSGSREGGNVLKMARKETCVILIILTI